MATAVVEQQPTVVSAMPAEFKRKSGYQREKERRIRAEQALAGVVLPEKRPGGWQRKLAKAESRSAFLQTVVDRFVARYGTQPLTEILSEVRKNG